MAAGAARTASRAMVARSIAELRCVADPVDQRDRAHPVARVEAHVGDEPVQAAGVLDPDDVAAAHRVPGDAPGLGPGRVAQVAGCVHLLQGRAGQDLRARRARRRPRGAGTRSSAPGPDARPQAALRPDRRRDPSTSSRSSDTNRGLRSRSRGGDAARRAWARSRCPSCRAAPGCSRERTPDRGRRRGGPRSRRAAGRRGWSTSAGCSAGRVCRSRRRARGSAPRRPRSGERPVGVRRLAGQAGLVGQHPPDRDGLDGAEGAVRVLQLRKVGDGGVVQVEEPLVTELHDRRAGERLRDRRDPVERRRPPARGAPRCRRSRCPPNHARSSPATTPAATPGRRCSLTKEAALACSSVATSSIGFLSACAVIRASSVRRPQCVRNGRGSAAFRSPRAPLPAHPIEPWPASTIGRPTRPRS